MDESMHHEKTGDCTLTAKIQNFTLLCELDKLATECSIKEDWLSKRLKVKIYPNGSCNENKGYVSIMFVCTPGMIQQLNNNIFDFEFYCTACILDANGDKKFLRSFVYAHDPDVPDCLKKLTFGFDEYVKRDTVLSNASELLPGDCLTVRIDITYRQEDHVGDVLFLRAIGKLCMIDEHKSYIDLDSILGSILCGHSNYFRRLSEAPMIERETRRVLFIDEEQEAILHILQILLGSKSRFPAIKSLNDILNTYVVAEKYDIQEAVEACRQQIERCLNSIPDLKLFEHIIDSIPSILELAEMYTDSQLREIASGFLKNQEKFEAELRGREPDPLDIEREWSDYFRVHREKENEDKPQLDFYT